MTNFEINFPEINYTFSMIFAKGTGEAAYLFGEREKISISIDDFFISKYPVTQRLWEYIMGNNPSHFIGQNRPVEGISFNDITSNNGFLDKLNASNGYKFNLKNGLSFRLPSETEWEYAARGGTHWHHGFPFSGSDNLNEVGWYEQNSGKITDRDLLRQLKNTEKGTETHDVGLKAPNQLGICDMSGNVWEWCEDFFQAAMHAIPKDGTPCSSESDERVLRGGCHHNLDIHCTVSKRYAITPDAKDECIGFRIAASA